MDKYIVLYQPVQTLSSLISRLVEPERVRIICVQDEETLARTLQSDGCQLLIFEKNNDLDGILALWEGLRQGLSIPGPAAWVVGWLSIEDRERVADNEIDWVPAESLLLELRLEGYLALCEARASERELRAQLTRTQDDLIRAKSQREETERILSENERTLRSIYRSIEATGESIIITDSREQVYYANPAYLRLSGFSREEVIGYEPDKVLEPVDADLSLQTLKHSARGEGGWQGDVTLQRKDGQPYEAYLDINSVMGVDGSFEGLIFIHRDITAMKRMLAELKQLARTDSLTGLYNRRYFLERLENECQRVRRYHHQSCLLMIDLDHFKKVNDSYGHAFGDVVLARTGALIQEHMRSTDFCGRYGGEEFCICLPMTPLDGGRIFAERFREELHRLRFDLPGGEALQVTASIGVVCLESGNVNCQDDLHRVDLALYEAKSLGRNRVVVAA